MRSVRRSTRRRSSCSSTTATSPVWSHPSASTRAVAVGVAPVAGEHVRALHPDLAGIAEQDVGAVLVDEADRDPGQGAPDRARRRRGGAEGGRRHDRGRLGEPVALVHHDAVAVPEPGRDGVGQRGGARDGEAHRRERVGRRGARVEPLAEHRGHPGEDGDAVLVGEAGARCGLEALDEQRRRARGEPAAEHDVQPEDVRARQHGEARRRRAAARGRGGPGPARCSPRGWRA